MKTLKKVLKVLALSFIIALAASGAGMLGVVSLSSREKYLDKEIKIERVDKNRDDDDDDIQEEKG